MTELLEVCLTKGELFSRSIWAPTTHLYLSLSPFHLIPSSHPFGLSRSFLKLQSQKGRERESQATGLLHNNIHMGDLNKTQNKDLSHCLKSMILRTTRFIYQFSLSLLFLSRKICQSFMLFSSNTVVYTNTLIHSSLWFISLIINERKDEMWDKVKLWDLTTSRLPCQPNKEHMEPDGCL